MQEFHAFMVSPNKEHKLEIPEGCGYHLSVVSLPRGANGKTTVYVSVDGKSYVLATLDSQANILQVPTDLIFNYQQAVTFFSKGSATVHCVGYRQALDLDDDDEDTPFAVGEDDSDAEVTAKNVRLPVDAVEDAAEAESASEEHEEHEEDEEEEGSVDHEGMAAVAEESEEEEEESEEESEEADSDIAEEPAGSRGLHFDPTAPSDEEDDESDDDEELESEGEEDEEHDEEADDASEEEAVEPPMKAARADASPNRGSPQRANGGSPQGR
ncbi:RNA binding protein-like protein, partial [Leptomonas seymouri]